MPVDDGAHARSGRIEIERVDVMHDVHVAAARIDDRGQRPVPRRGSGVRVATNPGHRRDRTQFVENRGRADIAGVDDPIHARERAQCLGAQQPVGVRDESDFDSGGLCGRTHRPGSPAAAHDSGSARTWSMADSRYSQNSSM